MSNWNESLNQRLQKERQRAFDREAQLRRERDSAPKPYRDPRSEKDRERELRNIVDQLGFKRMLEDVKRNIWDGRGKIESNFYPDDVSYKLSQFYKYDSSYMDNTPDGGWVSQTSVNDTGLSVGAKRKEGTISLYLRVNFGSYYIPQMGSCEFPQSSPSALGNIQQALLDAAFRHK